MYQRYGYLGTIRMQKIAKKFKVKLDEEEIYKTCIKVKSMKKLSKGKILRANILLERVFMDFWEPHLKGIAGASYYLSIVDDATRFFWIYMIDNQ